MSPDGRTATATGLVRRQRRCRTLLRRHRLDAAVATGTAAGAVVRGTLRTARCRGHRGSAARLACRSSHTHTSGCGARAAHFGRHARLPFCADAVDARRLADLLVLHAISRSEKRVTLTVDPFGTVSESRIKV